MRHNDINDDGLTPLAKGLQHNTSLAVLDLGHNNIEDEGVEILANALRYNDVLTELHLRYNNFGVEGRGHWHIAYVTIIH